MPLHQFLKSLRLDRSFTQAQVAQLIGVSRPTYREYEKSTQNLTIENAEKLASLYGLTLPMLFSGVDVAVTVTDDDSANILRDSVRISIPQKNYDKFKEVLIYILEKVGSRPHVGETVINKLLYFIDFDYYEKYEEQLIGASYLKNNFGPTPIELRKVIESLKREGAIEEIKSKYFEKQQRKYLPTRESNVGVLLTAREIKHIDDVLERLAGKNATELSNYSHEDVPWIATPDKQVIDYESVFYRTSKTSVRKYDEVL